MDQKHSTIKVYSAQTDIVLAAIERDGVCYSKAEYVRRKYQESAPIFLTAYSWFVKKMEAYVQKPEGAEYPYWAFTDIYSVDQSGDVNVLKLDIPMDQAVYFDMMDWNKIMRLSYIGENASEEKEFRYEMEQCGIRANDVMLTNFYPDWKQRIIKSWDRLFRHHEAIKNGNLSGVHSVQAGLWQIKKDWIVENKGVTDHDNP